MTLPPDYDEPILFYDWSVTYHIGFDHPSRFQDDRPKWTGGPVRFFWGGPKMKDLDRLRVKLREEYLKEHKPKVYQAVLQAKRLVKQTAKDQEEASRP